MLNVINVNSITEFEDILCKYNITIVDVYADFCKPCKAFSPIFESLSKKYIASSIKFIKMDIENADFDKYTSNISSIPYFLIFKHKKHVGSVVGANANTVKDIINLININL